MIAAFVDPLGFPFCADTQARLFEAMLHGTAAGVLITDTRLAEGGPFIVYANPAFCAATGYELNEVIGRRPNFLQGPDTDPEELERMRRKLENGEPVRCELLNYRRDGTKYWVDLEILPVFDGDGRCTHFVSLQRDVTQRRLEIDRARKAETRLRLATAAAQIGAWEWNLQTGEVQWDAAVYEILGYPPSHAPSLDAWTAAIAAEDLEVSENERAALMAGAQEREASYRIRRSDGSVRHVLGRVSVAERDAAKRPVVVVGVLIDVTELQSAHQRVIETLESITDAHVSVDASWTITYANRRTEELLGVSRSQLIGVQLFGNRSTLVGTDFEKLLRAQHEPVEFEAFYARRQRWYELRAYPLRDGVSVYIRDVSERHEAHAERDALLAAEMRARAEAERVTLELAHRATHDALTGLANRHELHRWMTEALQRGAMLAVLFFDLDRFKKINDTFGHRAGDSVMSELGHRLRRFVRTGDLICRFGGDEFVIVMAYDSIGDVQIVAERLMAAIQDPIETPSLRAELSASLGIALSGSGSRDPEVLLRNADLALYRAKQQGRNQIVWFEPAQYEAFVSRLELENELRDALDTDQLVLHFQPHFDLVTGRACGAEALLRWRHARRGLLKPDEFVGVAEESGLIVPIGRWVTRDAARHRREWNGNGDDFVVWVNASVHQLNHTGFAAQVIGSLRDVGLPPQQLGIEVTESVYADSATPATELRRLRAAGVKIALDDFGTGYSSLARLRKFPADVIKVDRSFIREIGVSASARAVVTTVIDLARAVGTVTVAEGVETLQQLQVLRDLGCHAAAGFLLARPVEASMLDRSITTGERRLAAATASFPEPPMPPARPRPANDRDNELRAALSGRHRPPRPRR